jgi:hypothetical protein
MSATVLETRNGVKFKVSSEDEKFCKEMGLTAYHFKTPYGEYTYIGRRSRPGRNAPKIHLHKLIMERMHPELRSLIFAARSRCVDHINGETTDNRRENLRLVHYSHNRQNSKLDRRNTSGFRGVHWNSACKCWTARLRILKKSIFLGYFADKEQAARAYDNAAKEQDQGAKLNFPCQT